MGAVAPDFTGTAADGSTFALGSLRGRPVVLFFYPKANSTGCRIETRGFVEHFDEFASKGVALVGVSVDPVEAQKRFAEACRVPFPLVSDRDGAIARQYGVLGWLGLAQRVTFLLDAQGRILWVVRGLRPGPHLQGSLAHLATLPGP